MVRDVWAQDNWYGGCVGTATTDRIHVSLEDTDGKAWDLSLSPAQVDEHRYAVGDELKIGFAAVSEFAFAQTKQLFIRKADELDLFFVNSGAYFYPASPLTGFADTDDTGLTFEPTPMTCSEASSGAACDTTGVAVSAGTVSVTEPCAQDVGDFKITASYRPRYCAPGTEGFCDNLSSFFAAGVRR